MKYWLHRITGGKNAPSISYPLFDKGYLSIGYCDFSNEEDLRNLTTTWEDFEKCISKKWGEKPRHRYNLWRFLNEFKPGDLVVVPSPYSFSVCEILDNIIYSNETIDKNLLCDWNGNKATLNDDGFIYNNNKDYIDLGFYRKVKIVAKNLSRWDYADQKLYSRLKVLQTNVDITDLKESVDNALKNKKINLKNSIIQSSWKNLLNQIHTYSNDQKFEELVGSYFRSIGGRIEIPSKNESPTENGDADVIAFFDRLNVAIMVQVKKHTNKTDDWAVSQIISFKKNHQYSDWTTVLWVVSTCDEYSEGAKKIATENDDSVRLINGEEFAKMILESGLGWIPS